VFLDRDGTLVEETGYLARLERLVFFPYSVDAVRLLNRAGYAVVVATNQAGVARGLFDEAFVGAVHRRVSEVVTAGGARIDGFYHCPHHPEGTVEPYRGSCDCRKPQPGLLRRAAADLDLDLSRSFVVGDRWSDVQAGTAVGARGLLVRTGYGRESENAPAAGLTPTAIVDNLIAATSWILRAA
jgi:D-glycero-D-manno-heptose 1,7-bisphosphate phosphatase